jgi:hypothetical protein
MSAPPKYGQTDALALAVVARINSLSGTFCIPVSAERRFRLLDRLKDIPAYNAPASVDVFPDTKAGQRQGISTAFASEYAIHIYIQQQVSDAADEEAQCALLARLESEIVDDIEDVAFNLDDAVHPVKNVFLWKYYNADENGPAKGLYNLKRLMGEHVYESDTILVFKASA